MVEEYSWSPKMEVLEKEGNKVKFYNFSIFKARHLIVHFLTSFHKTKNKRGPKGVGFDSKFGNI